MNDGLLPIDLADQGDTEARLIFENLVRSEISLQLKADTSNQRRPSITDVAVQNYQALSYIKEAYGDDEYEISVMNTLLALAYVVLREINQRDTQSPGE